MWNPYSKQTFGAEPIWKRTDSPKPPALPYYTKQRWFDQIQRLSCALLLSVASYVVARHCVVESVKVTGISMQPTLNDSGRYLVNKFVYLFRAPRVGDIVVIRDPIDGLLSVKRVVATPGDSIGFINGRVVLNGVKLKEPYLQHHPIMTVQYTPNAEAPTILKFHLCRENEFFVLGDNRTCSVDSRCYGPIRRQDILGKLIR